jgi:hypothetical protein
MKLEVGKKYVTRGGEIATIVRHADHETAWPFEGHTEDLLDMSWRPDGAYTYSENISDNDLVSECAEPKDDTQWTREQVAEMLQSGAAPAEFNKIKGPRDGGGMRHNAGKTRFGLLPAAWTRSLAEVMTKGAEKYAPRNWERGMDPAIMIDCAFRHVDAYRRGERYDAETGCHHLAHAAWNILALMTYDIRGMVDSDFFETDDVMTKNPKQV